MKILAWWLAIGLMSVAITTCSDWLLGEVAAHFLGVAEGPVNQALTIG